MPQEKAYVTYLKKQYSITMTPKNRFDLIKEFQKKVIKAHSNLTFKLLKNIDDPDEQQESIHKVRALVRSLMQAQPSLVSMA